MRTVWFKKLLDKFYSININNDCDILEFFSNHTIFYSIGEYIFSQIDKDLHEKNNNRVLKDKTIKSVFSCESLYNSKEFHYNDLKHMNDLDEAIWSEIINSDFKKLHEDAWNITNILINRFNCRYVVTQVFSDDFISVLSTYSNSITESLRHLNNIRTDSITESLRHLNNIRTDSITKSLKQINYAVNLSDTMIETLRDIHKNNNVVLPDLIKSGFKQSNDGENDI